jgi:hypothetical protein
MDSKFQDLLDTEIKSGERRLLNLETQIGHLKFLKTSLIARFPELKLAQGLTE